MKAVAKYFKSGRTKSSSLYCFDFDNNILTLPTTILIFRVQGNGPKTINLSTEMFAKHRKYLGEDNKVLGKDLEVGVVEKDNKFHLCHSSNKKINLKDYQVINQEQMSFKNFRDSTPTVLEEDTLQALSNKSFAPSWKYFINCLNCPTKSQKTFIITARGHDPKTILQVLTILKEQNYFKFTPPIENIYPVSFEGLPPAFCAKAQHTSQAKLAILKHLLHHHEPQHLHFSDDDQGTFELIHEHFQEMFNNNLIKSKVNLFYTGNGENEKNEFTPRKTSVVENILNLLKELSL